jgi:hypothetical protein
MKLNRLGALVVVEPDEANVLSKARAAGAIDALERGNLR